MSTETVLVSEVIPATKERLYAAWLDSGEHSAFTAETAAIEPYVGGAHTGFSGYASGQVLALEPNRRIVQSWRSTDFPDGAEDSRLEVTFEETGGGTMITLLHTGIPSGQSDRYREGWLEYYFERMKRYFSEDSVSTDGITERATLKADSSLDEDDEDEDEDEDDEDESDDDEDEGTEEESVTSVTVVEVEGGSPPAVPAPKKKANGARKPPATTSKAAPAAKAKVAPATKAKAAPAAKPKVAAKSKPLAKGPATAKATKAAGRSTKTAKRPAKKAAPAAAKRAKSPKKVAKAAKAMAKPAKAKAKAPPKKAKPAKKRGR